MQEELYSVLELYITDLHLCTFFSQKDDYLSQTA